MRKERSPLLTQYDCLSPSPRAPPRRRRRWRPPSSNQLRGLRAPEPRCLPGCRLAGDGERGKQAGHDHIKHNPIVRAGNGWEITLGNMPFASWEERAHPPPTQAPSPSCANQRHQLLVPRAAIDGADRLQRPERVVVAALHLPGHPWRPGSRRRAPSPRRPSRALETECLTWGEERWQHNPETRGQKGKCPNRERWENQPGGQGKGALIDLTQLRVQCLRTPFLGPGSREDAA